MVPVLVPTLNERANIGELTEHTLAAFGRLDGPAELVVMDDASPGTATWYVTDSASRIKANRLFGSCSLARTGAAARRGVTIDTWRVYRSRPARELR